MFLLFMVKNEWGILQKLSSNIRYFFKSTVFMPKAVLIMRMDWDRSFCFLKRTIYSDNRRFLLGLVPLSFITISRFFRNFPMIFPSKFQTDIKIAGEERLYFFLIHLYLVISVNCNQTRDLKRNFISMPKDKNGEWW